MTKKKPIIEYPVTISDWLTFLQNETNYYFNIIAFISTSVIVMTIGVYSFPEKSIWIFLTVPTVMLLIFFVIVPRINKKSDLIQELIDDIIEGDIRDPEEILNRWLTDIKPNIRKKIRSF